MSGFGILQENLNVWIWDTSRELKCLDLGYFKRTCLDSGYFKRTCLDSGYFKRT